MKGATRAVPSGTARTEYFNPRSREGSDIRLLYWLTLLQRISIHAPAKGATRTLPSSSLTRIFQSTLPRRERLTDGFPAVQNGCIFQSTLPRRERPNAAEFLSRMPISIHVPAKGATASVLFDYYHYQFQSTFPRRERPAHTLAGFGGAAISIHVPAKGATDGLCQCAVCVEHFNPRSREGSDGVLPPVPEVRRCISIHVPAKGATRHCQLFDYYHYQFQSTFPRRERPDDVNKCSGTGADFNPRSREGSDVIA